MVESTALEMRHTRKGIEGSNPSLSAIFELTAISLRSMPPRGRRSFFDPTFGRPMLELRRVALLPSPSGYFFVDFRLRLSRPAVFVGASDAYRFAASAP